MSLHERAGKWVARKIEGFNNHERRAIALLGRDGVATYPDVATESRCSGAEVGEVEVIKLDQTRADIYRQTKKALKRLWIVLPEGTLTAFDFIELLFERGSSFQHVTAVDPRFKRDMLKIQREKGRRIPGE